MQRQRLRGERGGAVRKEFECPNNACGEAVEAYSTLVVQIEATVRRSHEVLASVDVVVYTIRPC